MKRRSKLISALGILSIAMAILVCPAASISVQAGGGSETIAPYAQDIGYRYAVFDNKVYKRLYNFSTGEWIGDWIYVRDYDGSYIP